MPDMFASSLLEWLASRRLSWGLLAPLAAALVLVAVIVGAVYGHRPLEQSKPGVQWGGLLAFALVCGLISFAVLEMAKRLLPVREWLQARYVRQWWDARATLLIVSSDRSWPSLTVLTRARTMPFLTTRVKMSSTLAATRPWGH